MESELVDIHHYLKLFLGLFAMVEPLGASAVFVTMAASYSKDVQNKMAAVSGLAMFGVLFAFLVTGNAILEFFGITQGAFMSMGGIVLLLA